MAIRVTARDGESSEKLIIRFKRLVNKDGVIKEVKRRRTYEKPSERARRKEKERMKTLRKAIWMKEHPEAAVQQRTQS